VLSRVTRPTAALTKANVFITGVSANAGRIFHEL